MGKIMLQIIIVVLAVTALYGCDHDKVADRPNIVIILTDDLGYGDVSKFNPESKIQTPHIDALAENGVWCSDAHAAASVCSPSRYSLLTGRYAWRGKLKKGIVKVCDESVIEDSLYTLPKMLSAQGYHNACIGKWHLGFEWPWKNDSVPSVETRNHQLKNELFDWTKPIIGGPWAAGFHHYFGDDVPNFPPYAFIEDSFLTCNPVHILKEHLYSIGVKGSFHGDGPGEEGWNIEKVMPTITQKAVDYVIQMSKKDGPFFLFFSTTSPHTPIVPVERFHGKGDAGYYGDYVVQTDDAIGQVIQALKENDCFENTLLIVTSDNGPSPLIRDVIRDYKHFPAKKLRGMKFSTWEGGHRVPLIISWPDGGLTGGKRSEALISLVDIFGTIANVLDVDLPNNAAVDSYDIMESLKKNVPTRNEMLYQNFNGNLGLRQNEWVLIEESGGKEVDWMVDLFKIQSPDAPVQLFNLNEDLGQKINVFKDYPEKVRQMQKRLNEIRKSDQTR